MKKRKNPKKDIDFRRWRIVRYTPQGVLNGKTLTEMWQVYYESPDAEYTGYVWNVDTHETEFWT